ncbi:hypothetical protein [Oligosphaera ethanolica]|uniref:Uncharacterized protein n=1 Tax=Oligosphaera ethanolica TaxID=760260 RepID=A0AAE3VEX5_9BACT|nr:hypothetical protein [Oligosphaera ethanolica]MDQ0289244.1 hypothetical protein [Oligosphaera ethanolica]
MKKILMTLAMALMSASTFAAFQWSVVESTVAGSGSAAVNGFAYTIQVTEGTGSIYIVDKINNLYSMSGNKELLSMKADMSSTTKYGWVDVATGTKYSAEGSTTTFYNHQMNENNDLVTQTGYKLGEFSAGDEIGVWLTTKKKGAIGASVLDKARADLNSDSMNYRNAYVGTDSTGMTLHQLDFTGGVGSIFFGLAGVASPGAPIGQPLPGALATLLLGGAISGAAGMKKRRRQKA